MSNDLKTLLEYEQFVLPKRIEIIGKMAVKRARKNKDIVIAISGDEGEGKSTLAIEIGMAVSLAADLEFRLDKNMIYTNETMELREKLVKLPKCSPIIPDEAIKFLYKLNWASAGQKYINTLYSLARKENKITILPIPRFTDINEYFRNHRVKIWIHIIKEGSAVIFAKNKSAFNYRDSWNIQDNEKIIEKIRKRKKSMFFSTWDWIRAYRNCPNFVLFFHFPKLPDAVYGQYEILAQNKYEGLEEIFNLDETGMKKIPYREGLAKMIKELMDKGYDANRVSYVSGLNIPTINKILMNIEQEKGKIPV